MKKILSIAAVFAGFATAASAADFPVMPAKVALPVPVIFSWSGCYIGVEGGGNWGRSEQIARSGANLNSTITGSFDLSGALGLTIRGPVDAVVPVQVTQSSRVTIGGATVPMRGDERTA